MMPKLKKVTAWYGDSNFKFDGTNGEVLTYIPGFYYKREVIDDIEYQYISKYDREGYNYIEPFSVGRYKIGLVEEENVKYEDNSVKKIELLDSSINLIDYTFSSKNGLEPIYALTISQFREVASNFGSDFSQMDWHYYVIQMLYLVEYADYDVQAKIGQGAVNLSDAATMGGTDELGMKSGCVVNDGTGSSIYIGMEDLYSYFLEFIDGINIKDYQAYINYNYKTYESDKFDGDYKALGYVNAAESDENGNNGWITKLGYDDNNPLIGLATEVKYYDADYNVSIKDVYVANSGENILMAGGNYYYNTIAGLWYSDVSRSSDGVYIVGARLVKHQ